LAKKISVHYPETIVVQSHEELSDAIHELGLPLMVKGVYYEATLVHTREQALVQFNRMAASWGVPVIVQRLVTGDELNVIAVGDGEGGLLGRVGMRKTSVTALGKAWGAVTVEHRALLEATERFAAECHWRGPCELECIVDEDEVHLIEINPRFPAWVYFATGVGVNLPSRLLRHLFDRSVDRTSDYAGGRMFVRYSYELVTDMARFQNLIVRGEST
jgi:carbamoyl-phosphate synthase large subunit